MCAPGSDFQENLESCRTCIAESRSNKTGGFPGFIPAFRQYLDYCATLERNETQVGSVESYQNAVSSMSAAVASLAYDASLLGLTSITLAGDATSTY